MIGQRPDRCGGTRAVTVDDVGRAFLRFANGAQGSVEGNWIATGRKILTPSDDPVGSARALDVSQSKSVNQQFITNQGYAEDALKLVTRLVNIGDCKTLACHPASTTHRQLSPEELAKAGVSEDMIRLSVGIEHIDDLIADLDQALNAA